MLLGAIFKSVTKPRKQTTAEAYAQYAGTRMAASGNYKSPKSGFEQTKSDIKADFFGGKRDADYYARLPERQRKSQEMIERMNRSSDRDRARPAVEPTPGPTPEEIALEKRRKEGQAARKKFEKAKGERRIALRKRYMKLLKLT